MKSTEQPLWWYFVSLWKEFSIFIRKHCFTEIWRYAKIANIFPKTFEEDVSFEWSSHRVASTDSNVRTTYKINSITWKYCWKVQLSSHTIGFCPQTYSYNLFYSIINSTVWKCCWGHSFEWSKHEDFVHRLRKRLSIAWHVFIDRLFRKMAENERCRRHLHRGRGTVWEGALRSPLYPHRYKPRRSPPRNICNLLQNGCQWRWALDLNDLAEI